MRKYIQILRGLIKLCIELFWAKGQLTIHGLKYYIGRGVKFNVVNSGKLDLGTKTWISDNSYFSANGGEISIGWNNFFNTNTKMIAMNSIKIGDNNLIGPNVVIVDQNHKFENITIPMAKQGYVIRPVEIGSNVWLGANVLVCPGVKIADNIVVGGNSVVNKDLLIPGVYAGAPAKLIRKIEG